MIGRLSRSERELLPTEGELRAYTVEWETKPSPGATFYQGKRRIFALDDEQAIERGRREVARDMMLSPSSIRVLRVTRQVFPR